MECRRSAPSRCAAREPTAGRTRTHAAAGLVAARAGGRAGALLALATLASLELDGSGRAPWLRRLLPGAEGTNVIGRIPSTGETAAPGDPLAALRRDALMGGLEAPVDASARDLRRVEPVRARQARSRPGSGRPAGFGVLAIRGSGNSAGFGPRRQPGVRLTIVHAMRGDT